VLPRYLRQLRRTDVAAYLLMLLGWPGIEADKDILTTAVELWGGHPQLSFVDAYLAARGNREDRPVFTKNVGDFRSTGVEVPDPLPA